MNIPLMNKVIRMSVMQWHS